MSGGKVAVFHPGTQHSWQTARALQDLARLEFYATSIFYRRGRWPFWLERLPGPPGRKLADEFRRFQARDLNPELVRTHGLYEWAERMAARAGLDGLASWLDSRGNRSFGKWFYSNLPAAGRPILWGYDNSSLEVFKAARPGGYTCILDRTVGDLRVFNRQMLELQERYGDWFVQRGIQYPDRLTASAGQENLLADRIVVGCDFARQTLAQDNPPEVIAKTQVLEYCFDETLFAAAPPPVPAETGRPVRFLFAGLAIPRKGFHHVCEAIARFSPRDAALTVVGQIGVPEAALAPYRHRIEFIPAVPRADIPKIMARHDVLLFPTYFEGAGIVLYEALASGLALIQTGNAAVAVTDDTGLLLAQPDTELLVEAMATAVQDRARLAHWRAHAQAAAASYTFARYRDRISRFLQDLPGQTG